MSHVGGQNDGVLLERLRGNKYVAIERGRRSCDVADVPRGCPERRGAPLSRGCDGSIRQLACKFVESRDAPHRANSKQLATEFVIREF
jgi:hypothetical protein